MRDPQEGLTADGTIRTGVDRRRVPAAFEPVVRAVIGEFERTQEPSAELHLYGSVATGTARPGESDVDLVVIDGAGGWAAETAARLSRRYAALCRGVEIGTVSAADHAGNGDEAYGNRVFLRHYCVSLAGADALRPRSVFAGDVRAARGFNGDIATCLARWRHGEASPQRVARKTLVAAAGIVSVRNGMWTTDRATAVDAWASIGDGRETEPATLLGWADGTLVPSTGELAAVLAPDGIVSAVADRFAAEIGLWA